MIIQSDHGGCRNAQGPGTEAQPKPLGLSAHMKMRPEPVVAAGNVLGQAGCRRATAASLPGRGPLDRLKEGRWRGAKAAVGRPKRRPSGPIRPCSPCRRTIGIPRSTQAPLPGHPGPGVARAGHRVERRSRARTSTGSSPNRRAGDRQRGRSATEP